MARLAGLARQGALSVEDMEGGTFTISNGGVFGSLFGTPIINPPQSAILGMHGTFERPVAINGKVEVSTISVKVCFAKLNPPGFLIQTVHEPFYFRFDQ